MKKLRLRRSRNSVNRAQRYPLYAAIIVIVVLCVALTIVLVQKNRLDSLQITSLNEMAATTQSDIKSAVMECEKISLPGADVKGTILHNMRVYLYAAKTMNDSMINVYDFSMLDEEAYSAAQSAINAIEKQITGGRSYKEQLDELTRAMTALEQSVDSHFASAEDSLLAEGNVQ